MLYNKNTTLKTSWALSTLFAIFFVSGFTALLYQVVWQRMLGLFSGSDVRSVTIVIASYLAGLGIGNLIGGIVSDRQSNRAIINLYGYCNLGIATFALVSRFLFYDLLFIKLRYLAQYPPLMLTIVFISLLIPTCLMGISLPILSKAIARSSDEIAARIGLLYGVNTLGSGLGAIISGWYIIGSIGYEATLYLGAFLNAVVGFVALSTASQFDDKPVELKRKKARLKRQTHEVLTISGFNNKYYPNSYNNRRFHSKKTDKVKLILPRQQATNWASVKIWSMLVFVSGMVAISLEILWFRVLDVALQSNAYTYAHLLGFILLSNAIGSILGAKAVSYIKNPQRVFLLILSSVIAYSAYAIWLISIYWKSNPSLREDIGYIDPNHITGAVLFKYLILPLVMIAVPNLLLGFYFPLVQKAIQTEDNKIGRRVGIILVANILGNTVGSLITGLLLLDKFGTAGSIRLLILIGLGFTFAINSKWSKFPLKGALAMILVTVAVAFPNNTRLWASLHGIDSQDYFIVAEDATGVAAISQKDNKGKLFASGQHQADFPYMHLHAQLGTIPALLHPDPTRIMIIGLGSGGTPHTIGANPLTKEVQVLELVGAELPVLQKYSQTPTGKPLKYLFSEERYQFIIGDGRRELTLSPLKFDIIEADAIQPWRSRAGMLYSKEFFSEVRSRLAPGGFFVQWNVGPEVEQTFRHVFPYVTKLDTSPILSILVGSDRPVEFDREAILTKLKLPQVINYLTQAQVDIDALRTDILTTKVQMYSMLENGRPEAVNTDLFPRSEYYLNRS